MIPYIFILDKMHDMDSSEIICSTADDLKDLDLCMLAHIKDIFEENELYHSLNENMKYIKKDNITIKILIQSCYEQYWKEPYYTKCPINAKYFDGEWIDYKISKMVKEHIHEYLEENYAGYNEMFNKN